MQSHTPRINGFKERGHQVTRLEAFVDAAFAFAITLLVILVDQVPDSVEALLTAVKGIPSFAVSFAFIAMFWWAHAQWSKRYGLDDGRTVLLTLILIFLVLIYVYPLRMVSASFFHWISGDFLPAGFPIRTGNDLRAIFITYGIGFSALCTVMALLYQHALSRRDQLQLDALEVIYTRAERKLFFGFACIGILSCAIAILIPNNAPPIAWAAPGFAYCLQGAVGYWVGASSKRMAQQIEET